MAHRLASPVFEGQLQQVLSERHFDVVEFEGIEMVPYLSTLLDHVQKATHPPRLVFDDHNAEYLLQRRFFEMDIRRLRRWPGAVYSFVQWQKLKRYEAWACRHVDVAAAVSQRDAAALRRIVPGLQVTVVPNGVDLKGYASFTASKGELAPQSLVFTGKMDYRANVDAAMWFALRVFPLVQKSIPEARFYVVGQRPHPRLDRLREEPGVVITGRVPDTRPYIGGATVYVIPLLSGGGTRFKVLEAMALRCPIVSTSMGCDGFPVTSGQQVILADEPEAFAHEVVGLLRSPARRDALTQVASDFVARYDWSAIVPRLEATYVVREEQVD
jgi:glycosyltransferase involved in cell wall biosynthesis